MFISGCSIKNIVFYHRILNWYISESIVYNFCLNILFKEIFLAPKEVFHDLSESQIKQRLHICEKLLKNPNDERFFRRILTGDEKWIFLNNYNHGKQWLDKGDRGIQIPKDKN